MNAEFLSHSKEALRRYENLQIPFAAIKIRIFGLSNDREAIDKIVFDNFRSDKDFILRSKNDYAILMQSTSIEDAEAATHRLGRKLCHIKPDCKDRGSSSPIGASAWIYGAGEETKALHFRHLDLFDACCGRKAAASWTGHIGVYFKWKEQNQPEHHKPFSIRV